MSGVTSARKTRRGKQQPEAGREVTPETLLRRLWEQAKEPIDDGARGVSGKWDRRTCRVCLSHAPCLEKVPHKAWCVIPEVSAYFLGG